MPVEKITAFGHGCVTSKHDTTLEFTKDGEMGWEAHCIVGVKSSKSCADLSPKLKKAAIEGKRMVINIRAGDVADRIIAYGHPDLMLTNNRSIVIRRSNFIDDRTLAIYANKSSNRLNRELVRKLKDPSQKVEITIEF